MLIAATAAVLGVSAPAGAALPKITGTVGPGFTITTTRLAKKLVTVKAGTYSFTVVDKSSIHNYHLMGPGVNKMITSVAFVGTKTVTITLKKGVYRFVCDPHASTMKGSFTVT
jgi:plastocyanin